MDAEFLVELGADDPTLAVPWSSPDGRIQYIDLALHPDEISALPEVVQFPELGRVLRDLNRPAGPCRTAKCDAWFDTQMDVDDEPYQAEIKCACYIDLFFDGEQKLAPFAFHEGKAMAIVRQLRGMPDVNARAVLTLRRSYFQAASGYEEGLYWTVYVFGYGAHLGESRAAWAAALAQLTELLTGGFAS